MNNKPSADSKPDEPTLFVLPSAAPPAAPPALANPQRGARLRRPDRAQIAWGRIDLDAQLPADHAARAICAATRWPPKSWACR